MIKTLKGAVTVQSDSPLRTLIDVLPNNPRNQPDRHIPVLINPGNNEADLIFLSEHPVIVAAVDYGIDADVEADEDSALVDVGDNACILALNLAFAKVCLTGIAVHTLNIRLHGNILEGVEFHVEHADKNLLSIGQGDISHLTTWLADVVAEGTEPEETQRAAVLLEKLADYKPLAKIVETQATHSY